MWKSFRGAAGINRCIVIVVSSLFLLFLGLSQPHRVHHFFDAGGHAPGGVDSESEKHDHGQNQSKPAQTDCTFKTIVQNCHLGQAALVQLPSAHSAVKTFRPQAKPWIDPFASFPFLQRAPPQSARLL
jgi:hypothetical protein